MGQTVFEMELRLTWVLRAASERVENEFSAIMLSEQSKLFGQAQRLPGSEDQMLREILSSLRDAHTQYIKRRTHDQPVAHAILQNVALVFASVFQGHSRSLKDLSGLDLFARQCLLLSWEMAMSSPLLEFSWDMATDAAWKVSTILVETMPALLTAAASSAAISRRLLEQNLMQVAILPARRPASSDRNLALSLLC